MRLITTMMTTERMEEKDVEKALQIISSSFNYKSEVYSYKYDENKYFEVDIDLLDVVFTKENLYQNIRKLIEAYELIMQELSLEIDFIVGNDDTGTAVDKYESDWNDIKDFGLFVTRRTIEGLETYYESEICNAYLNLSYVSFGVYDL